MGQKRRSDGKDTWIESVRRVGVLHALSGERSQVEGKVHSLCNRHMTPTKIGGEGKVTCMRCVVKLGESDD